MPGSEASLRPATVQLGRCRRTLVKRNNRQRSLNLLAHCFMRPGETASGGHLMGDMNQAGSAVLHKRIRAFGSMAIGFGLMGIDPVSAVALALLATVVLAML